jgi:hypothetical protein
MSEAQRRNFVTDPRQFLNTDLSRSLVPDKKLADCLLVYTYDCIGLKTPILDYSGDIAPLGAVDLGAASVSRPSSPKHGEPPATPHGVASQMAMEDDFGGRRRRKTKRRGGMMAAEENPNLRLVVKATILVSLLVASVGAGYVTFACIKNLAALYGIDTVTLKILESIFGLTMEVAGQSLPVGERVASAGLQVTQSTTSLMYSFGVRVKRVAEASGKLMQMTPLIAMARYVNNSELMYAEIGGIAGRVQGTFRSIVTATGQGFTRLRDTFRTIKGEIEARFAQLTTGTAAATAAARQGVGNVDEKINRTVDRILGFISEAHQGELNAFFTSLGDRVGSASAMAVEGASTPLLTFIQFLKDISSEMFEGIVENITPDIEFGEGAAMDVRADVPPPASGPPRPIYAMLPPTGLHVEAVSEPRPGDRTYFASTPGRDSPRLGGKRSRKRRRVRRIKSRRR